ncbi:small ribosomal subunit protein uS13m [Malus domestica]|uniref:small ribosomal subunit protein uS13m n=1 Tax=Malus domestica TaxID=3750 RepID=UPI0039752743
MPEYKSRNGDSRQEAPQVCASVHTGIGRARAGLIISELNMTNKLAEDLTRREVAAIGEEISKYLVGRELAIVVEGDIKRMIDIQCYKGIRHIDKLPGRGQRISTNSRTKIARTRIAIASSVRVGNFHRGRFLVGEMHSSPGGLAPVEGCCRASASWWGFVGQGLSGKAGREGQR